MNRPLLLESPRVVVPVVAGIGNALMAQPMVRQLKRNLPGARITIAARTKAMAAVFDRMVEVDACVVMDSGALGMARSMVRLQLSARPDICLIPFPSNRWQYMALALASGARFRVMHRYSTGAIRALGCVPALRLPAVRGLHDVVQNLYLLRLLGVEPDIDDAPRFVVTEQDRCRAAQILAFAGIAAHVRFIAIHPGSARTILAEAKRWPLEMYARLVCLLASAGRGPMVVLEGPDEDGMAHTIACMTGGIARAVRLRGPLGEAAAVLERARLYVGSDSGLAHLAAAVGTPPVTLFGPADPDRVCPFGYRRLVVQAPDKRCSPCFMYPWEATSPRIRCDSPDCVRRITPESVLETIETAERLFCRQVRSV